MSETPGEYMVVETTEEAPTVRLAVVRCPGCNRAKGRLVLVNGEKWLEVYGPEESDGEKRIHDPMVIPWVPFAKCKCGEIIRFGQRKDLSKTEQPFNENFV